MTINRYGPSCFIMREYCQSFPDEFEMDRYISRFVGTVLDALSRSNLNPRKMDAMIPIRYDNHVLNLIFLDSNNPIISFSGTLEKIKPFVSDNFADCMVGFKGDTAVVEYNIQKIIAMGNPVIVYNRCMEIAQNYKSWGVELPPVMLSGILFKKGIFNNE